MEKGTIIGVRMIPIHDGRCLFQLRDNKPEISHPNKWGFVGGSIEGGETFEEAIRRECEEEIGINPSDLHYLGRSETSACFYVYLSDLEALNLKLGEGQEIRFFNPDDMAELSMTPKLEELVTTHRMNLQKLIEREKVSSEDFGLVT